MRQTTPYTPTGTGTAEDPIRPLLPGPPEGQYLAWSSTNEAAGTVDFEFADIPAPPDEPAEQPDEPAP